MKRIPVVILFLLLLVASPAHATDAGWWIGGVWVADQVFNKGKATQAGAGVVRELVDGALEIVTLGVYDRSGGKIVVHEYPLSRVSRGAKVNDAYYGGYISPHMYQPPEIPYRGWGYHGYSYDYDDYSCGRSSDWRSSWPPPPKECYQRGLWEGRREKARRECEEQYRRGYRDGLDP